MHYAAHHHLDEEMTQLFIVVVRELDAAYLTWTAAEEARKAKEHG